MNILLVDDHPLTVLAYKNIISENPNYQTINFKETSNCEQTFSLLLANDETFDLAIIDYRIPSYAEQLLFNGADLALFIKTQIPKCKLLIITATIDHLIVYDILKKIDPDGFVIKSEIDSSNLNTIINEIIYGNTFYCNAIKKAIKNIWKNDVLVDKINRKIVTSIVKGYTVKEISDIVNLSLSSTQKRLNKIEKHFNVNSERELIKTVFKKGLLILDSYE